MKQTILLLSAIAFFCFTTTAQIRKGALLVGGQLSYLDNKVDWTGSQSDQKIKRTVIGISVGTAIKENKIIGFYGQYSRVRDRNNYYPGSLYNTDGNAYNAGLFYRQYKKLARDFYFFGELGAGYVGSDNTDTEIATNSKTNSRKSGGELYLTPGLSYRVYKKLQLELLIPRIASLEYSVTKNTTPTNTNSKETGFWFNSSLSANLLNSVGIGFRFVL